MTRVLSGVFGVLGLLGVFVWVPFWVNVAMGYGTLPDDILYSEPVRGSLRTALYAAASIVLYQASGGRPFRISKAEQQPPADADKPRRKG